MTYTYDQLNRLATVTDASGTTTYDYDAVGNLASYSYPNGILTSYSYDSLNRLTSMQSICGSGTGCRSPGAPIASYAYSLGATGNRLSVSELSGRKAQYDYDDLYRLTSETISQASAQNGTISYQYDAVGNRLKINSTVPVIPASGLLNYDANDRTSTDVFDNNGNTINDGTQNVYDFENRLVQRGNVTVVYDGDGNRVSETVAGITTNYLVADQNLTGFAQVFEELQNGGVTRSYSYGLELINQHQTISGIPTTSFYGYDGHGSVRFLTDANGAVTDTYDYDAFGILIASTGSTPNTYLFAGEQFDLALGVYYNRARYYDQRIGRFWSADTVEIDPESPASLHKYLYASANPVNRIDPSGNEDFMSTMGAMAIQAQLFVMAHPVLTAIITGVLLSLAPEDFVNALPPTFGEELQLINAAETEVRELGIIKRLLNGSWLEKFKAGRNFEEWMLNRILANIEKEATQLVVKDGAQVVGQARVAGSAVIDAIIRGVITEFKTSFGAASKYQSQQFARYAKATGQAMEYVFLHKPTQAEVDTLARWVHEVGQGVKLTVTYILE